MMISVLHLLWIVPVVSVLSIFIILVFLGASKLNDIYDSNMIDDNRVLFSDWYRHCCDSDFNTFTAMTNGFVYCEDYDGQLSVVPVETDADLNKYSDYVVVDIYDKYHPIIKGEII
jgi:hypothetical protein